MLHSDWTSEMQPASNVRNSVLMMSVLEPYMATHSIPHKYRTAKTKKVIRYYRPKRSFGQGNIFTGVCLSTGGGPGQVPPLQAGTPPPGRHPPSRQAPPPPGRHPPSRQAPPPPPDTVNARPVRILLECILVVNFKTCLRRISDMKCT